MVLCFTSGINAQNPVKRNLKKHLKHEMSTGLQTFLKGSVSKRKFKQADRYLYDVIAHEYVNGDSWELDSETIYTYENNNLDRTELYRYYLGGEEQTSWIDISKSDFEFNTGNKISSIQVYVSAEYLDSLSESYEATDEWEKSGEYRYFYDESFRIDSLWFRAYISVFYVGEPEGYNVSLSYNTDGSISYYNRDSLGVIMSEGIFLEENGNVIDTYSTYEEVSGKWLKYRDTYFNATFEDLIQSELELNDYVFYSYLSEEYDSVATTWNMVEKYTVTEVDGVPVEAIYVDNWDDLYYSEKELFVYESGLLTEIHYQEEVGDSEWKTYARERITYKSSVANEPEELVSGFKLSQNYPNPFNPTTTISFDLEKSGRVSLTVFNILGKEVSTLVNGYKTEGNHFVSFDASGLPSGIYYYKITTPEYSETKSMTLIK